MTTPDNSTLPPEPSVPAPDVIVPPHHSVGSRIRNYFLTGLIVAGPVAITIWLIWSFVTWVDDLVRPFIPVIYRPETYLPIKIPGFGLIIAFLSLIVAAFPFICWLLQQFVLFFYLSKKIQFVVPSITLS